LKPLTAERFDRMAPGRATDRIIWTLPAIGRRIGVGPDFVRDKLAKQPGSPVKEIGGRYYAFEEDLIGFLRSQQGDCQTEDADRDRCERQPRF
jgi:hypothetical protein